MAEDHEGSDYSEHENPHRAFAIEAFNRSWELLETENRTDDQDAELLSAAFASRWHWQHAGGVEQLALGDHQIAKSAAVVGLGDLSARFARRAWNVAEVHQWTDWKRAAMAEGMARACVAQGDDAGRDHWFAVARDALATVADAEDREVVESQLVELPGWTSQ